MKRKCRRCGRRMGRRTGRAGQAGFCSKVCWHAWQVHWAMTRPELLYSVSGGRLTPQQAQRFMDLLNNRSTLVLDSEVVITPLRTPGRIRFGKARTTNADLVKKAVTSLGDLGKAQ